jgi:hypothetical protein
MVRAPGVPGMQGHAGQPGGADRGTLPALLREKRDSAMEMLVFCPQVSQPGWMERYRPPPLTNALSSAALPF